MSLFIYPATPIDTTGLATEAKQDVIITELEDVNTELDAQSVTLTSLDGKDFATETTLATVKTDTSSIDGKIIKSDTDDVTITSSALPTGAATETTVASIAAKDFATETTLAALAAEDFATETTLASIAAEDFATETTLAAAASDISDLNDRLAGALVPLSFNNIQLTYVAAGNGAGEISTAEYRTGGAGGTLVATLTLSYDGSNRLSGVTRS